MRKFLFLLLAVAIALTVTACSERNGDLNEKVRLEVQIVNETTENKSVYIRYPVVGGLEESATLSLINNSIQKYVETRQKEFADALASSHSEVITSNEEAAENSVEGEEDPAGTAATETAEANEADNGTEDPADDEAAAGEEDKANLSMSLSMTFQVVYNENNLLNITEKFYQTLGEGKKTTGMQSFVFDLKRGKVVTLGELFDFSGDFAKTINGKIQNEIEGDPTLLTFEDKSGFTGISKESNYYMDGTNLYIFYEAYEIGPSKTTIPTFTIPIKEIASYLNPDYSKIYR